jgi:hypothetical protein
MHNTSILQEQPTGSHETAVLEKRKEKDRKRAHVHFLREMQPVRVALFGYTTNGALLSCK